MNGLENEEKELRIRFYTDGACSGNPGPMGVGIVAYYGNVKKIYSFYEGEGTNNRAELLAVIRALETVKCPNISHVQVFSDSDWVVFTLRGNYKAKKNLDLIEKAKKLIKMMKEFEIFHIRGHNGDLDNELADKLARKAITDVKKNDKEGKKWRK